MSAIIGGLIATVLVYLGVSNIDSGGSGDVTIAEAPKGSVPARSVDPGGAGGPSVRDVYDQDGPGVVTVEVASRKSGPAGGSGFVIDDKGHVVTNQHVVEGADGVSVSFASGARQEARVVGQDPSTDVAVIQVDAPKETLKPLTLGDSEAVGVGDPVIAIGNPLDVGISVTTGIVSGIGRPIKAPNNYTINGAVQTDAAINPGNSGGPLLDARGTVIGINSQIFSETGGFQGVGFAVPINTVKSSVEQLIETGKVEHGFIGVRMFPVGVGELSAYSGRSTKELSDEYGLPENGAIVSEATRGGPAAAAGLKGGAGSEKEIAGIKVPIGDVVTRVGGKPVSTPDDVIEVVNSLKPGDELPLTVVSPGKDPREVKVRLGVQPAE